MYTCTRNGAEGLLQVVAAFLLLKALTTSGTGYSSILLQPGLECLVMRLILSTATFLLMTVLITRWAMYLQSQMHQLEHSKLLTPLSLMPLIAPGPGLC